jgi:hypothetical protein
MIGLNLNRYTIAAIIVFGVSEMAFGQALPEQYSFDAAESHTPEQIRYLKMCNSWLGSDIKELIIKWGIPNRIIRGEDGELFIYERFKDFEIKQFFCTTQFKTNKNGIIVSSKAVGDGCWEPGRWLGK